MNDSQPPQADDKIKNLAESLSEELGSDPIKQSSVPQDNTKTTVQENSDEIPLDRIFGTSSSAPLPSQKQEAAVPEGTPPPVTQTSSQPSGPTPAITQQAQAPTSSAAQSEDLLSLEDLDRILNDQDPLFSKNMSDLQKNLSAAETTVHVRPTELDTEFLKDYEKEELPKITKTKKTSAFVVFFVRMAELIFDFGTGLIALARNFRQEILPLVKKTTIQTAQNIGSFFKWLAALSALKKLNFGLFVITSVLVVIVVGRAIRGLPIIPSPESPFLRSFEQVATQVVEIKPDDPVELFDNPLRNPEYVVLFTKMFVNLKPAGQSRNPMAAFEIFIEASSQESAIELKDRERQFKDVIARVFEAMPYDEIVTPEGKNKLKLIIRRDLNQNLNKGRVKKVYFKTFFYKS